MAHAGAGFFLSPQDTVVGLGAFPAGNQKAPSNCNFINGSNWLGLPQLDPLVYRHWNGTHPYRRELATVEMRPGAILAARARAFAPARWHPQLTTIFGEFAALDPVALQTAADVEWITPAGLQACSTRLGLNVRRGGQVFTTILRIHAAEFFLESPETAEIAQLFIDQHLLFASVLKRNVDMDDPAYAAAYPVWNRGPWRGSLPDLSNFLLTHVGITRSLYLPQDTLLATVVWLLLCKPQAHRCLVRNFAKMVKKSVLQYAQIMPLVLEITFQALLGNYPGAKFIPSYDQRIWLMKLFLQMAADKIENNILWVQRHERLVYMAVRMYFLWNLDKVQPLKKILFDQYSYDEFTKHVMDGMNAAREHIFVKMLTPSDVNPRLKQIHERINDFFTKLHKSPSPEKLAYDMQRQLIYIDDALHNKIENSDLSVLEFCRTVYGQYKAEKAVYLQKLKQKEKGAVKPKLLDRVKINRKAIPKLRDPVFVVLTPEERALAEGLADRVADTPFNWVHPALLQLAGCDRVFTDELCGLFEMYDAMDKPDHAFVVENGLLYQRWPRDYAIASVFLNRVVYIRAVKIQMLPKETAVAHYEALRRRLKLLPYEPVPKHLCIFYYCRGCNSVFTPILTSDLVKNHCSAAIGIEGGRGGALYDYITDQVVCNKYRINEACTVPLEEYPIWGRSILTPCGRFEMCVACGGMTRYELLRRTTYGLVCGCEVRPALTAVRHNAGDATAVIPVNADPARECEFCGVPLLTPAADTDIMRRSKKRRTSVSTMRKADQHWATWITLWDGTEFRQVCVCEKDAAAMIKHVVDKNKYMPEKITIHSAFLRETFMSVCEQYSWQPTKRWRAPVMEADKDKEKKKKKKKKTQKIPSAHDILVGMAREPKKKKKKEVDDTEDRKRKRSRANDD